MGDLEMVLHGEGLRRMRWNSEPLERVLIQANLIGDYMAEWATWEPISGDLTLVGTNGIAKYRHVGVEDRFMVFERLSWRPIAEPGTGPCDLHELTGCSICSGLDKQLAKEDVPVDLERLGSPPPGHAWAQWPGACASCGEGFDRGDPIRFSQSANGWVCCG